MSTLADLISEGEHVNQDFKFRIDDKKKIARTFKTNEFICLFCDDYDIMLLLIKNYCNIKNVDTIKKYSSQIMSVIMTSLYWEEKCILERLFLAQ